MIVSPCFIVVPNALWVCFFLHPSEYFLLRIKVTFRDLLASWELSRSLFFFLFVFQPQEQRDSLKLHSSLSSHSDLCCVLVSLGLFSIAQHVPFPKLHTLVSSAQQQHLTIQDVLQSFIFKCCQLSTKVERMSLEMVFLHCDY